ncbi:MAG: FxLYD domain-containing protein [Candidatus Sulfobium sp.]|jgi:hypothetical protein
MSDTESKIIKLLNSAKKKGDEENTADRRLQKSNLKNVVIVLLAACLLGLGIWTYSFAGATKKKVAVLSDQITSLRQDLAVETAAAKETEILKEIQAYADKLRIANVRVSNMNHEVRVSGKITNTGSREIEDIELTLFCLDKRDKPVCEQHHIASSPDYEPLKRYQNRRFRVMMGNVPSESKEIEVIVTDIEFAD